MSWRQKKIPLFTFYVTPYWTYLEMTEVFSSVVSPIFGLFILLSPFKNLVCLNTTTTSGDWNSSCFILKKHLSNRSTGSSCVISAIVYDDAIDLFKFNGYPYTHTRVPYVFTQTVIQISKPKRWQNKPDSSVKAIISRICVFTFLRIYAEIP